MKLIRPNCRIIKTHKLTWLTRNKVVQTYLEFFTCGYFVPGSLAQRTLVPPPGIERSFYALSIFSFLPSELVIDKWWKHIHI